MMQGINSGSFAPKDFRVSAPRPLALVDKVFATGVASNRSCRCTIGRKSCGPGGRGGFPSSGVAGPCMPAVGLATAHRPTCTLPVANSAFRRSSALAHAAAGFTLAVFTTAPFSGTITMSATIAVPGAGACLSLAVPAGLAAAVLLCKAGARQHQQKRKSAQESNEVPAPDVD